MSTAGALRAPILAPLICGILVASGGAATASAPPQGTLTQTEYRVLSKTLPAVKKALFGKSLDLTLGESSCRADGGSTPLMGGERVACTAEVGTFQQFEAVEVSVLRCQALYPTTSTTTTSTSTTTGTTTTGTTDGYSTNQLLVSVCESSDYQRLTRYVNSIYTSAARVRQRALQRGFTGACVDALGASSSLIADERRFASATKQISVDVSTLAELNSGASPAHVPSSSELTRDALAFELALNAYATDAKPSEDLSACAHE